LKSACRREGIVAGVIDFGALHQCRRRHRGLIHISEISWERVDNPRNHVKVSETVKTKIIAIDRTTAWFQASNR